MKDQGRLRPPRRIRSGGGVRGHTQGGIIHRRNNGDLKGEVKPKRDDPTAVGTSKMADEIIRNLK